MESNSDPTSWIMLFVLSLFIGCSTASQSTNSRKIDSIESSISRMSQDITNIRYNPKQCR